MAIECRRCDGAGWEGFGYICKICMGTGQAPCDPCGNPDGISLDEDRNVLCARCATHDTIPAPPPANHSALADALGEYSGLRARGMQPREALHRMATRRGLS